MRFRTLALPVTLACGIAAGLGCPADPRDAQVPPVIVKVGETAVPRSLFVAELARMGAARVEGKDAREAVGRKILDRLIREELLYQAATKAGLKVDPRDVDREVQKSVEGYPPGTFQRVLYAEQLTLEQYREKVRRRLLVDAFLKKRMKSLPPVSEADVRARYEQTVAGRVRPPLVRARQVLVKTEEEANHLLGEIRGRRLTVEEAARRFSVSPEKDRGGDLGWFAKGDMPPVFEVCFSMKPGDVSDVVASEYGFHIFELVDRREAHEEPFEEAKARLEAEIQRERERADFDGFVEGLKRSVPISVNEQAFQASLALLPERPPEEGPGPDPMPDADWSTYPKPRAPNEERAAAPEPK